MGRRRAEAQLEMKAMKTKCMIVFATAIGVCAAMLAPKSQGIDRKDSLVTHAEPASAAAPAGWIAAGTGGIIPGVQYVNYLQGESDPSQPGNVTSDSLITGAIIREIIQERLAGVMSNVRVITRDGFVTLRGTVPEEFYRRRLGAIAASVVPPERVDNRVVVSPYAQSSWGADKTMSML